MQIEEPNLIILNSENKLYITYLYLFSFKVKSLEIDIVPEWKVLKFQKGLKKNTMELILSKENRIVKIIFFTTFLGLKVFAFEKNEAIEFKNILKGF